MAPTDINAITQRLIDYRDGLTDRSDRDMIADACNALDAFAKLTRAAQGVLDDDDPGVSLKDQRGRWNERMAALKAATSPSA